MRLFEARTILEDLAVIARLKRLGVRGDAAFHRDDALTTKAQIQEVTSGGALRLCALDALDTPNNKGSHRRIARDHLRDLEQARINLDLLLKAGEEMSLTDRGAMLGRIAKLMPEVADGLEAVKSFNVLHSVTTEDINEIVVKHRALMSDYGAAADALKAEAEHLGAHHRILPQLAKVLESIERLLGQHVLFCPKPLHGEKAYEEWTAKVTASQASLQAAKTRLEQLSTASIWAAS